ncbi:chorismate mutase [Aquabacterium sp.]|uniref:chorismate mutase n=1 Tax=Aquabacterium sp. TaxID=1872578 RepID=UPI0025B7CC1C|nr:chorismate mutase [Aquabacterium sp.]
MTPCDTLADVRSAIDQIDFMLVGLLAERGRYVNEAARFKRNKADVAAPDRVRQVIDKALRHARDMGAPPEVVEAVYRSMITAFIELESLQHDRLNLAVPADEGTMAG